MRVFKKTLSIALVVFMMMTAMCMTAFATDTTDDSSSDVEIDVDWIESNITAVTSSGIVSSQSWLSAYLTPNQDDAGTNPQAVTDFNGTPLYLKSGKTASDLQKKISSTQANAKTTEKVSNITDGLGLEADTSAAAQLLSGFMPILELILGIMVTLITVGMTIYSAFDIMYIAFPVFRNKMDETKANGGNSAMTKQSANGETTLRFVTQDAQFAVQQGTIESGKSPWGIYFKRRVMSYILLAIILFILMTGNISLITNIALKVVSGIMNVLVGLG